MRSSYQRRLLSVLVNFYFNQLHLNYSNVNLLKKIYFRVPLLNSLIGLFELPEDESLHPDDHFVEIEDTPGYSPAYSQLAHAQKPQHDPLSGKLIKILKF